MLTILWVAVMAVFAVVEAVTVGLVSIWFVVGAAAAMLLSLTGAGIWAQLLCFALVSAAALALTRPLMRKFARGKSVPTNADRVLGAVCKVTETIDNESASGAVYVDGKTWTARSADGKSVFPAGSRVLVESMEGVKLFVKKVEEKTEVTV